MSNTYLKLRSLYIFWFFDLSLGLGVSIVDIIHVVDPTIQQLELKLLLELKQLKCLKYGKIN